MPAPLTEVVAILRGVTAATVLPVADALVAGGVACIEVPLNSPGALTSIRLLADHFADRGDRILIGAGTVLTVADVARVKACGGDLVVSPNVDAAVIKKAQSLGMVCMPGVFTPTEALLAASLQASGLKLFPADLIGPKGLRAMKAVLPKDLPVYAVGGVSVANVHEWREAGARGYGLGTALWKPGMAADEVTERTRRFIAAAAAASKL